MANKKKKKESSTAIVVIVLSICLILWWVLLSLITDSLVSDTGLLYTILTGLRLGVPLLVLIIGAPVLLMVDTDKKSKKKK